ncbi:MAG: glycosyltransferase family 2 protein [Muribaculaceae bacterium]|nr:glycosyltransferase family 2 protein [Muribaculaceae bacterium]
MLITLFTPTYNRAHLLPRLYESLKSQTYKDFEWLIVDDGSNDGTEDVIKKYIEEDSIQIRYIKQQNGGKHRAINRGVRESHSELFFIVDSDDKLPNDALERVIHYYNQVKGDNQFAGVCGLRYYFDGTQVGGEQPFDVTDCSMLDIRQKHHIQGDMAEVLRTNVMREFPFPEIEGEYFCPEALVWNRISQKYIMRYFHENIYECEYQPDGLTAKIVRIRMDSPFASMQCYADLVQYDVPLKTKLRSAINYWRFRFCAKRKNKKPKLPWYWNWTMLIGWMMHRKDLILRTQ